jgi:hypothetical protein
LDFILDNRLYQLRSPPEVEELYDEVAPHSPDFTFVTASQVLDGSAPPEQLVIPANSHVLVAKALAAPELSGEVERAVWQVERQLKQQEESRQTADIKKEIESPEQPTKKE